MVLALYETWPEGMDALCVGVGSDVVLDDTIGPLAATGLGRSVGPEFVLGHIADPVDGPLVEEIRHSLPTDRFIIVLDAAPTRKPEEVGQVYFQGCPARPGSGVGRASAPFGDVTLGGFAPFADAPFPTAGRGILRPIRLREIILTVGAIVEVVQAARMLRLPHLTAYRDKMPNVDAIVALVRQRLARRRAAGT